MVRVCLDRLTPTFGVSLCVCGRAGVGVLGVCVAVWACVWVFARVCGVRIIILIISIILIIIRFIIRFLSV